MEIRALVMCRAVRPRSQSRVRGAELTRDVFDLSLCGHVDKTLK
ncbi:hypothetical protein SUDANB25_04010 [Streptomyces sp. SudanB25_2051]